MLEAKEVCKTLIADCLIFHFGSLSLTDKPNLRESLWDDLELAKRADLHEIQPEVPYTEADLNWMDKKSRSSGMGNTNKELEGSCPGADLREGKRFPADASEEELKAWAEGFGI